MKHKVLSVLGNIFFYSIILAVLVSAYFFSMSDNPEKSIGGFRFYEVLSGSMEPTIKKGELVFIKLTPPEEVKVGDIVTKSLTEDGSSTLTHRVIDIFEEEGELFFQTKGDNSPDADEPIPASAIIGIVKTHIPYVGKMMGMVKSNTVPAVIIMISLVIIVGSLKVLLKKEPAIDHKIKIQEEE